MGNPSNIYSRAPKRYTPQRPLVDPHKRPNFPLFSKYLHILRIRPIIEHYIDILSSLYKGYFPHRQATDCLLTFLKRFVFYDDLVCLFDGFDLMLQSGLAYFMRQRHLDFPGLENVSLVRLGQTKILIPEPRKALEIARRAQNVNNQEIYICAKAAMSERVQPPPESRVPNIYIPSSKANSANNADSNNNDVGVTSNRKIWFEPILNIVVYDQSAPPNSGPDSLLNIEQQEYSMHKEQIKLKKREEFMEAQWLRRGSHNNISQNMGGRIEDTIPSPSENRIFFTSTGDNNNNNNILREDNTFYDENQKNIKKTRNINTSENNQIYRPTAIVANH
ncbi:hypothetical protein DASC09_056350 [Saccharomycopsis crataegensis]|uniref:Uncharacterized protein n=1 Tax=Saccharomycopsis crataegensis TaxID=43959 RepID=A0AAV5QUU1_9ASCO|nr:hypothetical protein DASC09_056350 [Saccharomycopsis crataegensis]